MKCSQQAGRSPCALDAGHKPPCYAKGALPTSLDMSYPRPTCQFCHVRIIKGLTVKGNKSVFDNAPPHPNHWITCVRADAARRAYRPGRPA